MATCGQFSHDLIDPKDRATWDSIKLVRCTIVALSPRLNTVDVELGEDPPTGVPDGELTDIDCVDILPIYTDSWSDDGKRRRLNMVPIYYHCQGSTGTIEELKTGHMAFNIPLVELTTPPYSAEDVEHRHEVVIREKALLLYIPPTPQEYADGYRGYRYVIGHTDRNDIAPCKSEYICLRIHDAFDTDLPGEDEDPNPNYGHSTPEDTVVTIVDPIGRRTYKGLVPYGISFPCKASDILDKVLSITLDEDTPLEDIAFLDLLYTISPLYPGALALHAENIYYSDSYCHDYYPLRLCWLTCYFDRRLQCAEYADRTLMKLKYQGSSARGRWSNVGIQYQSLDDVWEDYLIHEIGYTEYEVLSGGLYRLTFEESASATVSGTYGIPTGLLSCTVRNHTEYENCNYIPWRLAWYPAYDFDMFRGYSYLYSIDDCTVSTASVPCSPFALINGWATFEYTSPVTAEFTIDFYSPWQSDFNNWAPWHSHDFVMGSSSELPSAGNSGNGYSVFTMNVYSYEIMIGRRGSYALSALVYGNPSIVKAQYAFNPNHWYGQPMSSDAGVYNFKPLPGAGQFLEETLEQMYIDFEIPIIDTTGSPAPVYRFVQAFVIDVVE